MGKSDHQKNKKAQQKDSKKATIGNESIENSMPNGGSISG